MTLEERVAGEMEHQTVILEQALVRGDMASAGMVGYALAVLAKLFRPSGSIHDIVADDLTVTAETTTTTETTVTIDDDAPGWDGAGASVEAQRG